MFWSVNVHVIWKLLLPWGHSLSFSMQKHAPTFFPNPDRNSDFEHSKTGPTVGMGICFFVVTDFRHWTQQSMLDGVHARWCSETPDLELRLDFGGNPGHMPRNPNSGLVVLICMQLFALDPQSPTRGPSRAYLY